jgi:hypothetical protein
VKRWLFPALAAVVVTAAGCGPDVPDYQSVWTTTTTPTTPSTSASPTPVPVSQFLEQAGVQGDPVAPDKLTDLVVTLPRPKGWTDYQNPNFAPGTRMIAKGDTYPTAMLLVFKLTGPFDVNEAVKHGWVDAEMSENFKRLNASNDNWHGYPSSMIEGSYDLNGSRMQSYNRIVFPTGSPPANQRYLVQLTLTTFADKAQEEGPDIEEIIRGFNVAPK